MENLVVFSENGTLSFYRLDANLVGVFHSAVGYEVWSNAAAGVVVHDVTDAEGYRIILTGLPAESSGQILLHLALIDPSGVVLVDAVIQP
jgi:hypothetical protein